jgi:hypothetical protein
MKAILCTCLLLFALPYSAGAMHFAAGDLIAYEAKARAYERGEYATEHRANSPIFAVLSSAVAVATMLYGAHLVTRNK